MYAGPYFKTCISQTDLDELNIEIIRNALYKVDAISLSFSLSLSLSLSVLPHFLHIIILTGVDHTHTGVSGGLL